MVKSADFSWAHASTTKQSDNFDFRSIYLAGMLGLTASDYSGLSTRTAQDKLLEDFSKRIVPALSKHSWQHILKDPECTNAIMLCLLPHISQVAQRHARLMHYFSAKADDAVCDANFYALQALHSFNPEKCGSGVTLVTYVCSVVKKRLRADLRDADPFGRESYQRRKLLAKCISELSQQHCTTYTPQNIPLQLLTDAANEELVRASSSVSPPARKTRPFTTEDVYIELDRMNLVRTVHISSDRDRSDSESIVDKKSAAHYKAANEISEMHEFLKSHFSKKEQQVLELFYLEHCNVQQISLILEVTKGRVTQILRDAKRRLLSERSSPQTLC